MRQRDAGRIRKELQEYSTDKLVQAIYGWEAYVQWKKTRVAPEFVSLGVGEWSEWKKIAFEILGKRSDRPTA